jgi:hypothetical protein
LILFVAVISRERAWLLHGWRPGARRVELAAGGISDRAVSGVESLAALGVCVVLGRLATVIFPIVAHYPHFPDPRIVIRR